MKTNLFLLFAAILFFTACNKNDSNTTTTSDAYINTTAGSNWSYQEMDSSAATPSSSDYTVTSTSQDTMINGRKYHVYAYSYGGSKYISHTGTDYYEYDSIPVAGNVDRLFLKDNASVGTTWSQTVNLNIPNSPIPAVPVTLNNKVVEKGISRTVNGKTYTNVIHVASSITSSLIPSAALSSSLDGYYAPNYGMIESSTVIKLDYLGLTENVNLHTNLTGADLK
jgi:hypothetical protein